MDKYLSALSKLKFSVVLLILGFFAIFASFYQIDKLSITLARETNYVFLGLGFLSIGLAVWMENSIEKSPAKLAQRATEITGRRFANLVYLYAKDSNAIALGKHEKIGHLPPGRRLEMYESPDEHIIEIVRDQMGIKISKQDFVSPVIEPQLVSHTNKDGQTEGQVDIRLSPIWMQLETHPLHRSDKTSGAGVDEHLDFVFLCVLEKQIIPKGGSRADCGWFDLADLENMIKPGQKRKTPVDVLRAYHAIREYLLRNDLLQANSQSSEPV